MTDSRLKSDLEGFSAKLADAFDNRNVEGSFQALYAMLTPAEKPADPTVSARLGSLASDFLNWVMGATARDESKDDSYFKTEARAIAQLL